jgi:hypothetical protein
MLPMSVITLRSMIQCHSDYFDHARDLHVYVQAPPPRRLPGFPVPASPRWSESIRAGRGGFMINLS